MTLLCRVEIRSDRVDITLSRCRLIELLAGTIDLTDAASSTDECTR